MRMTRRRLIRALGSLPVVCIVESNGLAGGPKVRKYRYSDVDIPVSLAEGRVRTATFAVKPEAYYIMLQVEKRLPFRAMQCMMALATTPIEKADCHEDPLVRAEWTVWDEGSIVAQGMSTPESDGMYTDEHMYKFLGQFTGGRDKKYSVEANFTKDGSQLDVCNPRLIVVRVKYH